MDERDAAQLGALVDAIERVLGDDVVAAYLYGSALLGVLRVHSDLDVFVVVDHPTDVDSRRNLTAEIMAISGRRGTRIAGRPLEVTVVQIDQLRPWRAQPCREFQYGEWLRDDYESGHVPAPEVDPDLAVLVATLLTSSRPLIGRPAADLLPPIPHDELMDAMRSSIDPLLEDLADDTVNVLLTLARMAYTARFGRITTKDEAASWALERLRPDERVPLALAREVYLGRAEASAFDDRAELPSEAAAHLVRLVVDPPS